MWNSITKKSIIKKERKEKKRKRKRIRETNLEFKRRKRHTQMLFVDLN